MSARLAAVQDRGVARSARSIKARLLTMPEQIAEVVTAAVLRGEYNPGDAVREQELADQFQVSRGPIREALRILEKNGVLTIVPQRGAHITLLSAKEVNNLFEIRGALVRLLPRYLLSGDAAQMEALESGIAKLAQVAESTDEWSAYADSVYEINRLLVEICANAQLGEILRSLGQQTARYTRLGLQEPTRRLASARGWRRFLQALKRGDADGAGAALVDLIDASRRAVLNALTKRDARRPAP